MAHLSREELIDSLDAITGQPEALSPARREHMATCARCRAEREALAATLRDIARVDMPEPSPLFWEHLSARVQESVAHEPVPVTPGWISWATGHWAWSAVTLAVCITVGSIGWYQWRGDAGSRRPSTIVRSTGSHAATDRVLPDDPSGATSRGDDVASRAQAHLSSSAPGLVSVATSDADWNLMVRVVEDVSWDEEGQTSGLGSVRPGTTDAVVRELSPDERQELVRLLREEMQRPPSS